MRTGGARLGLLPSDVAVSPGVTACFAASCGPRPAAAHGPGPLETRLRRSADRHSREQPGAPGRRQPTPAARCYANVAGQTGAPWGKARRSPNRNAIDAVDIGELTRSELRVRSAPRRGASSHSGRRPEAVVPLVAACFCRLRWGLFSERRGASQRSTYRFVPSASGFLRRAVARFSRALVAWPGGAVVRCA
jgi:hypothetical protein